MTIVLREVISVLGRNHNRWYQSFPSVNIYSDLINETGNQSLPDLEETRLYMHCTGSASFLIHKAIKIVQLAYTPREAARYKHNQISFLYKEVAG